MSYVTSIERIGREEGQRVGLLAGLRLALEAKFGAVGRSWAEELAAVTDVAVLDAIVARFPTATTLAELQALVRDSDA